MELFDKKFVRFMWDDELKGKKCFVANYIGALRSYVEKGNERYFEVERSNDADEPFQAKDGLMFSFAYYDPNYDVKKAFNEGKKIQYRVKEFVDWEDYTNQNPCWDDEDREWRVKPEKKLRPYESSAEMIADFIVRFKVNCPPYCKPLIWVFDTQMKSQDLIESFVGDGVIILNEKVDFKELLEIYQFLDGSPVGIKEEQ